MDSFSESGCHVQGETFSQSVTPVYCASFRFVQPCLMKYLALMAKDDPVGQEGRPVILQ